MQLVLGMELSSEKRELGEHCLQVVCPGRSWKRAPEQI